VISFLKLALLEGDDEGGVEGDEVEPEELGAVETLGEADGELESPVEHTHSGPEEGAMLKVGFLEADEEGCAETLGNETGVDDPEEGTLLPLGVLEGEDEG
jgi:hypothetical protein